MAPIRQLGRINPVRLDAGQARQLSQQAVARARRARLEILLLIPVVAAVLYALDRRQELFGLDQEVRIAAAVMLVVLAWSIARRIGQVLRPRLGSQFDRGTAGVVDWVVRLGSLALTILVALRIAGVDLGALALGASFTAVVVGLAAQQTFGNVFAGLVLLTARPFRVGDRVRFNGFGMDVEGTVQAHGLLYVTCSDGDDLVLVPNNTALTMSVRPRREPAAVDLRGRFPLDVDPLDVQAELEEAVSVPLRHSPHIELDELDRGDAVLRVRVVPRDPADGGILAREVQQVVGRMTAAGQPAGAG
jgi:small conductance mechanosensitive channel